MTMVSNHPDATMAPTRFPLVDDDAAHHRFRVHRDTMTSPEIFREELDRIFGHSWLYVGHESEVAAPGDYVRRPVAGRPVFMVRGAKSGNVHVAGFGAAYHEDRPASDRPPHVVAGGGHL